MINQTLRNNALFDAYGSLLTPKQQDIYICTYKEDLSLAEVAENNGISRAAVHDALKKSQIALEGFEEKLHLLKKDELRKACYEELLQCNQPEVEVIVMKLKKIDEM